jgi:hypothetical protein
MRKIIITAICLTASLLSCKKRIEIVGNKYKGTMVTTYANNSKNISDITLTFLDSNKLIAQEDATNTTTEGTWSYKTETADKIILEWNWLAKFNSDAIILYEGKSITGKASVSFAGETAQANLNIFKQ